MASATDDTNVSDNSLDGWGREGDIGDAQMRDFREAQACLERQLDQRTVPAPSTRWLGRSPGLDTCVTSPLGRSISAHRDFLAGGTCITPGLLGWGGRGRAR